MTEPARSLPNPPEESPPADAVERAFDAAQRLLFERLELARLDLQDAVAGFLRVAVLAGTIALIGWATITAALIVLLNAYMPLAAALGAAGLTQLALAGGLLATRTRRRVMSAEGSR